MASSPLSILPSMEDDLKRVEDELLRVVSAEGDFLTEIASHLILAGGKRVRPGFAIAASSVLDPEGHPASLDVIRGGCAVELVHIGSLYHDDVMDDATTRRSVKSVNAEWGNLRAILAGDYLLGRSSELASALGTEVAGILATTITELCEGQILELESAYDPDRSLDAYERSIAGKTSSLLATACRVGAIVGDLPRPVVEAMTEFGTAYGMAFQVVDDILDIIATDQQLGKPAGNDLVEGIYTLPVIHALADPILGPDLRPLLTEDITSDQRDRAREIVRGSDGVRIALDVAQSWADKAAATLTDLPDTPGARALRAAADHLIERAAAPLGRKRFSRKPR
ncbi:MAG: polyprenyl synthetase family protein [Acidimicrobiales bacterium]|nr:polyprenyl synthetase family protein [Acidimicrobiales bacterium]